MPMRHGCLIIRCLVMQIELQNKIFFAEVERQLAEGHTVTIKVKGHSMTPLLRDGRDSVVVRAVRSEDIKLGQLMFFRYRGAWVMHRLCRIDGECLTFAGDGNYRKQESVLRSDVVATVIAVRRKDGRVVSCDSRRWHRASTLWLALHPFIRRVILSIIHRLKL